MQKESEIPQIMNQQKAAECIRRYMTAKGNTDKSTHTYVKHCSTLATQGCFDASVFVNVPEVCKRLAERGVAENTIRVYKNAISAIFKGMTPDEKIAVYDAYAETLPVFARTQLSAEEKIAIVDQDVHKEWKTQIYAKMQEMRAKVQTKMDLEYFRTRYIDRDELVHKLYHELQKLKESLEKRMVPKTLYDYGLLMAVAIYVSGDKTRRLDICATKFDNITAEDGVVYDEKTYMILIKECNKVHADKNVTIAISDELFKSHLDNLVKWRRHANQNYLFCKVRGKYDIPDEDWFGPALKATSKKYFNLELGCNELRKIVVIHSVARDGGNPVAQQELAAQLGHSYSTRQNTYNLELPNIVPDSDDNDAMEIIVIEDEPIVIKDEDKMDIVKDEQVDYKMTDADMAQLKQIEQMRAAIEKMEKDILNRYKA